MKFKRRAILAGLGSLALAEAAQQEANAILFSGTAAGGGGGVATTLVPWTITNNIASTQTNIPVEVPVPIAAGTLTSNDSIQVLDSDGVTVLPCQEDNRCSNYAGTDPRVVSKVTVILPTITSLQKRQLTVQKLSGTPPVTSGTDVTVSEALATSYNTTLSIDYKDGNTYTADAASGLNAGPWADKTTAANNDKWQTGGGFVTSWKVFCPFSRSGGTIFTTNNLGAHFIVSVFKASRGAVNGGNPIIAISTKYWINCGYAQITPSAAVSHWFDLSVTSGTNTQSWVGSSPAKTLTLSTAGSAGNFETAVVTVPAGGTTFTQSSVGQVITDGATGSGLVNKYVSATQVEMRISTPFSGTSISSGSWRMWGVNHQYASDFPQQEIWYGGSLAITTKPDVLSHLGTSWNGTTGGPMSWFISTKVLLPFSTPVSDITNNLTNINATGPNPVGMGPGYTADQNTYLPTTGGQPYIAPVPGFQVGGLIKFDSDGLTRIMVNASKLATMNVQYRDQTTGKCGVPFDNGTNYVFNPEFGSNRLPRTNYYFYSTAQITDWTPQVAHHPNSYYVAWLLTGDYYWVEKMQSQLFWLWSECPDGSAYGTGYSRLFCLCDEQRGNGWNFRDIMLAMFCTPDRNPSMLGYTRANIKTLFDNQFTRAGSGTPGVAPYPGLNTTAVANTGSGKHFATSGYRYIGNATATPSGSRGSLWQLGYGITGFFMGKGIDMLSSDADAFLTWAMEGITGYSVASGVNLKWFAPVYYFNQQEVGSGNIVNDWDGIYRASANDLAESGSGLNRRLITGTGMTLSGLSGSAVTFTAPAGYFDAGGIAFYANGMIRDYNASALRFAPMERNTRVDYDTYAEEFNVGTSSGSRTLVNNSGTIKVWNTGSTNIYCKLTVGPGTATLSDTLITPGNYGKFTVGSNTYLNYIAQTSTSSATVFGTRGTGYAIGDTIPIGCTELSGNATETTAAVLTVSDVGASGEPVAFTISNAGLYIATSTGRWITDVQGATITQASTSGSGTGFQYRVRDGLDTGEYSPFRFGTGFITGVNTTTHVITIDTTISMVGAQTEVLYGYPFAQTGLTTNKTLAPAPYPGDADGSAGFNNSLPTPYTTENEYWTIQYNCAKLAEYYGYTNGATARAAIAAAYTGPQELKWRLVN